MNIDTLAMEIAEVDGVAILNCTPHEVRFLVSTGEMVEVKPCGLTLKAAANETVVSTDNNVTLVKTEFVPSPEGGKELGLVLHMCETYGRSPVIVGSIISAQAWPGLVHALVPAPGFERAAPTEKRFLPNKFTVFS